MACDNKPIQHALRRGYQWLTPGPSLICLRILHSVPSSCRSYPHIYHVPCTPVPLVASPCIPCVFSDSSTSGQSPPSRPVRIGRYISTPRRYVFLRLNSISWTEREHATSRIPAVHEAAATLAN
ncbi:uncharacterized protein MYCFIDRAFT_179242 [Pseudocercospora fijiensis CIRAD86]|uniref:Uncharacterized protein n=1 Tax=Pseudocercospora fijiensis (strain CIRAD86) TaxID=383855 RepID=M2ZF74_PSEFD|nr:uncharacterized protein MYCFIDRAFT_179242 [Pseudocercospora fijiensis CIRAD86]EME77749.1 hypothetical protein MYCFIDRAFT_179242 [Pseudocercospora fijiensis CIRAD86]